MSLPTICARLWAGDILNYTEEDENVPDVNSCDEDKSIVEVVKESILLIRGHHDLRGMMCADMR